jgi:CRISPR/Cas system-associated exonuclease Cas4 (RecB family)
MDEKAPERKNLFLPGSAEPFRLSRSKLSLYLECPRCFYLECRHGVKRPDTPGYALNVAVDTLLKREFDQCRKHRRTPRILTELGIRSTLSPHPSLKRWRNNLRGITHLHEPTNLEVFGALDDIWEDEEQRLEVVDYKATARKTPVVALDKPYHDKYRRQVEVYQWLLRMNGERVSETAYFLYCTARTAASRFDRRLMFDITAIRHEGDTSWIEPALFGAVKILQSNVAPERAPACRYCAYRLDIGKTLRGRK